MDKKNLGSAIRQRRKMLKINQRMVSDLSQVSINTVTAIENGVGNPRLDSVLAVAETLGLQLDIKLKD